MQFIDRVARQVRIRPEIDDRIWTVTDVAVAHELSSERFRGAMIGVEVDHLPGPFVDSLME